MVWGLGKGNQNIKAELYTDITAYYVHLAVLGHTPFAICYVFGYNSMSRKSSSETCYIFVKSALYGIVSWNGMPVPFSIVGSSICFWKKNRRFAMFLDLPSKQTWGLAHTHISGIVSWCGHCFASEARDRVAILLQSVVNISLSNTILHLFFLAAFGHVSHRLCAW